MRRAFVLLSVLGLAALAACNAVVGFDEQPCSPYARTEAEKCLTGYVCVDGGCRKGTLASDAGTP